MASPSFVDRWRSGLIPETWDAARRYFVDRLGNLERILSILHGAVEHPRASVDTRIASTGTFTAITTTSETDIAGATTTFTPIVDMSLSIVGIFDVQCTLFGATNQYFVGFLNVNGTTQNEQALWGCNAANNRTMVGQVWTLTLKSGTSYTIKMRAKTTNAGTQFQVNSLHTGFVMTRLPRTFRPS